MGFTNGGIHLLLGHDKTFDYREIWAHGADSHRGYWAEPSG